MTEDNRKAHRVRFDHKHIVSIMGVDGTWRRSCVLIDASASGAKLEVEGSTDPLKAQEFFLVLSSTGLAFRRCELIWVDGSHVGVQFVTAKTKAKARQSGRHLTPAGRMGLELPEGAAPVGGADNALARMDGGARSACSNRNRSYEPATNTYVGQDDRRQACN